MTISPRIGAPVMAAAAALSLALAGCSSSSSGGDHPATSSQLGSSSSVAAPTRNAIVFAQINDEGGQVGSFPEMRQATLAAVDYINKELGGVDGHPLKVDTCVSDGTPEGSSTCANELLADHPVAFLGGADFGSYASLPIIQKAGLAYLGGAPLTTTEFTSGNSVQFSGFAAGALPALAIYASDVLHAKKVAVINVILGSGITTAQRYVLPVLKARGITDVKVIDVQPSTVDYTSAIAAASQTNPDVIIAVVNPQSCVSVFQAHQTLSVHAKILIPGACLSEQILAAAGSAANGAYGDLGFDPYDGSNADSKTFLHIVKTYAPSGMPLDDFAGAGVNTVMNVAAMITAIGADNLTTTKILAYFRDGKTHPNFLAKPYLCNGKIPTVPSLCNAADMFYQVVNGKAQMTSTTWYDGSPYLGG
jgi:branched-chain amino acid transport system substrate-binding protein